MTFRVKCSWVGCLQPRKCRSKIHVNPKALAQNQEEERLRQEKATEHIKEYGYTKQEAEEIKEELKQKEKERLRAWKPRYW